MIPSDYTQCDALTQLKANNKEEKNPSKNTRKCTKKKKICQFNNC